MSQKTQTRHNIILDLGVERASRWKAHPVLKLVVLRATADGGELRVQFLCPESRAKFLRDQKQLLAEVKANPESRKAYRVAKDDF